MRIIWKHPDTPLREEHRRLSVCDDATLEPGQYLHVDPYSTKAWRDGEVWTFGRDLDGTILFLPRSKCEGSVPA